MKKTLLLMFLLIGLLILVELFTVRSTQPALAAAPAPTLLADASSRRALEQCRASPDLCRARGPSQPCFRTLAQAMENSGHTHCAWASRSHVRRCEIQAQIGAVGAPTIIFKNPSLDARAVPTYTLVSATFDQDMNPSTINSSTFFVTQGSNSVSGSIRYITISRVAAFYPSASLVANTMYTATVTTGVQNLAGTPLVGNVVWSFTTTEGTSPVGNGMNIYFGDLHSHSSYSDGQGTPADAFATARANGLDFFALTDHSSALDSTEWQDALTQANTATVNGAFVGLRGFEYSHANGHINVFETDTFVSETDPNYNTLNKFYAWLAAQPNAIGQFNHPYKTESYNWNFNDFAFNAAAAQRMYLRETPGYPADQYLLSLNAGWHLGAVDNSDTHQANWGRWRWMGVVAPSLTKDGMLEALRARRTFSTDNRNFAVSMQANGYWMGSSIPNAPTIHFTVTTYEPNPTEPLLALVLYDNGDPITGTLVLASPVLCAWTPSVAGSPGHFYYAKAYHDSDGFAIAYTSPVWMLPTWNLYLPTILRGD